MESALPIASTRRRIAALLVDRVIFLPLLWLDHRIEAFTDNQFLVFAYFLLSWQTNWVYSTVGHGWQGRTLGKALFGLRVVRDADGGRLGSARAFARDSPYIVLVATASLVWFWVHAATWFGASDDALAFAEQRSFGLLSNVALGWVALDVVTMIVHRRRRALHDLLAGSVVVSDRSESRL